MKAQISGQIFVFIFALIVASSILLLGYNYLNKILAAGEEADLKIFQDSITSDVQRAKGYGTEFKNKQYTLPPPYKAICFADLERITAPQKAGISEPLIKNSVTSGTRKNAFLSPDVTKSFYIDNLAVKDNYLCFVPAGRIVKISMVGCGDRTIITNLPSDTVDMCS